MYCAHPIRVFVGIGNKLDRCGSGARFEDIEAEGICNARRLLKAWIHLANNPDVTSASICC